MSDENGRDVCDNRKFALYSERMNYKVLWDRALFWDGLETSDVAQPFMVFGKDNPWVEDLDESMTLIKKLQYCITVHKEGYVLMCKSCSDDIETEDSRVCKSCKVQISEGYCINDGEEYFCNDHEPEYFQNLFKLSEDSGQFHTYWTQWDEPRIQDKLIL